ncbi:hypothetical protein K438DRAFT_1838429 [Mycena galopus ATCC 62051]|nr:hypothetical protein K438DRAFT_1838429 [Mycena galopus ATCC 62051]
MCQLITWSGGTVAPPLDCFPGASARFGGTVLHGLIGVLYSRQSAAWIIRPDELQLENDAHLGGRIAQGRWRNCLVIVKVLSKQAEPSALHTRGELWTSLRHSNVLQMFGVSPLDADPLYVVTQFQPDGNVLRFLERNPNADRARIVYDVVLGMQYLHARGVVHGSLKPANILVGDGKAYVSDYGMIEVQTSGSHGHRYSSPEAWKGTVSRSSDVFAWAMSALEIFTSKAPWGILSEKQIFRLVVRQDSRPDRPDEDFGLTDQIWGVMEECWHRESRLRPTFDILARLLHNSSRIQLESPGNGSSIPRVEVVPETPDGQYLAPPAGALSLGDSLASLHLQRRHLPSMMTHLSAPPAYEVMSTNPMSTDPHPNSAPPAVLEFTHNTSPKRSLKLPDLTPARLEYTPDRSETPSNPHSGSVPPATVTPPTSSSRTPANFTPPPRRQYTLDESDLPSNPHPGSAPPTVAQYATPALVTPPRRIPSDLTPPPRRQYTHDGSDASSASSPNDSSSPRLWRKHRSRRRRYDPIPANTIYRTGTSATLIEIFDAALSDDIAALAVWCLARTCRTVEVANDLLRMNLGRVLVTKGLKGGQRTARISAWCLGILVRSDSIAESLTDIGLADALCEHLRRCSESINAGPEDYSATVYAVARLSRSIKISKALAKGGCVEILSHFLVTAEDPRVLLWTARAIGCLMRPNSSDMAKVLLDAGIARGLARLPSMLSTEEVEPLESFAFAIQRFSCAEWGSGTRKALVDAGVVDSLLAALRTAADEPFPQVHIELAYAIALLSDVGGSAIRKQIVNAGGIDILKQIASTARSDVAKACNIAATSIKGNLWSRNTSSAKAAMAHEWSGGCPDYLPECPVPLNDLRPETSGGW